MSDVVFVDCPMCGHSNGVQTDGHDLTTHKCWLCRGLFVVNSDGDIVETKKDKPDGK